MPFISSASGSLQGEGIFKVKAGNRGHFTRKNPAFAAQSAPNYLQGEGIHLARFKLIQGNAMTIFEYIRDDHAKIGRDLTQLADDLKKLSGAIPPSESAPVLTSDLQKSFTALKRDLLVHMLAEEEAVYNRLRENPATRLFSYEGDEQHEIIHTLLDKLEDEEIDRDGRWLGTFSVLRDLVGQHVALEESRVFQEMERSFLPDQLRRMVSEMREEKLIVSESLHNAFLDRAEDTDVSNKFPVEAGAQLFP